MSTLPQKTDYLIIGAGIHGLSTAYYLAKQKPNKNIIVLDKGKPGDGASGIACGVVRNNYFQPAMRELMAHSVNIWEEHAKTLHYNPVGYMQISFEGMHQDVSSIYQQQKAIGYSSDFIEGEKDCMTYMQGLFHDWQAKGITSVLHEKRGGFAHNTASITGLKNLATQAGAQVVSDTEVEDLILDNSGAVNLVKTSRGDIQADEIIIAPGPWVKSFWEMLNLPKSVQIKDKDGNMHERLMWHYWMLQEGVLDVDPKIMRTNDGKIPPVIHVDSDQPLISNITGKLLTDKPWGIYYKPDENFGGVQGGYAPFPLKENADDVEVDPYGTKSKYLVDGAFIDEWCSALAFCQKRFEGLSSSYRKEPSGGLGCLTPDSFPIFDRFRDNVYLIADSNHGYKMIGVGALVAQELSGTTSALLEPFRFNRYQLGKLHPVSNSPFPWS